MDGLLRDLRFALRALRRTPLLFATAVLTLAAATGLATGVFAVAYGVLLRPLPYPESDRLLQIAVFRPPFEGREGGVRLDEFPEWKRRLRAFERVAAHTTADFTLRGAGDPRSVRATAVTEEFFDTLGMNAAEGSTRDVSGNRGGVALTSRLADAIGRHGEWRERGLTVGARDFGAAAIMPPTFTFPTDRTDLWISADAAPQITLFSSRDQRRFTLFGRLAPGVTIEQARDDVRRVVREVDATTPSESRQAREADVFPLQTRQRLNARTAVLPFVGGAILVLLIASANVSGLLIGRAVGRQREYAVRRALGGGLAHVLRASLAESFVVALLGWGAGLWIAWLVVVLFESRAAALIPNLQAVHLDAPVLVASFALAVLVALVSGGAPALRAVRSGPAGALKQASDRIGRGGRVFRGVLVAGQIALTVVLLVAAGLLIRTVAQIVAADRGFDSKNAVALRLMLTQTVRFNATERAPFLNRLVDEVRKLPGVVAAGIGSDLPPNGTQVTLTIRIVRDARDETVGLSFAAATPGYLEAIGARLVSGRLLDESDRFATPSRIVITEAAARALFEGREAVGREWPMPLPGPDGKRVRPTVAGVVRDIQYGGLDRPAQAAIFAPWERLAPGSAHLVVRTAEGSTEVAPALRRLVHDLDPSLPLFAPQTLDEVVAESIADRRLRQQLGVTFALLALALAAVALWGAVAQSVLDRRHELAVRLALGATSARAVRLMLRGGFVLIAIGVGAGGAGSALAARALRHLIHGISPFDPLTFAAALIIAAVVSLVACYIPARRAASISPADLLREI